jgi:nucleotide-binding universal stress UspA family protein
LAPLQRIVVGFDGSPASERALSLAQELARPFRAHLMIVAAVQMPLVLPPEVPANADTAPSKLLAESVGNLRAWYAQEIDKKVASLAKEGISAEGVVRDGGAVDVLLHAVEEVKADLLIVGSRGLSRTQRLLLGSVSTAMATTAPCPVLVVRDGAGA